MSDSTYREVLEHPVYTRALREAGSGDPPTEQELDALKLPPAARRKVADQARLVAEIRSGGDHQDARERAKAAAVQIVGDLPPELRRSDYLRDPEPESDDPRALAEQVTRW